LAHAPVPSTQPSVALTNVSESGRKPEGAAGDGVGVSVGVGVETGAVVAVLVGEGDCVETTAALLHDTKTAATNRNATRGSVESRPCPELIPVLALDRARAVS
jgi:hypothetical protein